MKSWLMTVAAVWLMSTINAWAEDASLKDDLGVIRSGIATVTRKIESMVHQKETIVEQLSDIENRFGDSAATLKRLHDQIEQKRQQMQLIHQDIALQKDEIALHSKALAAQLRADFVMSRPGKLKLVLNRQDLGKANRLVVYHDYLRRQRLGKLAVVQKSVAGLADLESRQREEAMLMERDVEKTRIEQSALEMLRKERNKLLSEVEQDFSSSEKQLERLKSSESDLQALIEEQEQWELRALNQNAGLPVGAAASPENQPDAATRKAVQEPRPMIDFARLKGRLPWPLVGKAPAHADQVRSFADGILIGAQEGAEVRAVTRGKVVYAQWLTGYGLLMILDHGHGFMTLYGFNQSLYRHVDDWVEAGDVIAGAGQSGGRTQSGLYFGIRKEGKPVDPMGWYPG